ncbi:neutral/alkaline non-lysosomal ceramidase N-terminal domain-containing protein [Daejeonella sp.]|uniref:neutral/alkaline non-lysosomal ceramidase N-terminal domain-containing protein n=1 Tax=Daejeonella sp. TaxID=2805397 RepID=UPI0030C5EE0D
MHFFTDSNRFYKSIVVFILVINSTLLSANTSIQTAEFKVGAAKTKMTPPRGSIIGDSYGIKISDGVHDDLYIKTLVFEHRGLKVAFITLDAVSLPHMLVMKSRELIHIQTGIPVNNIVMNATHAHAGPQMNPLFWNVVGGPAKLKSQEYTLKLPDLIVASVKLAVSKIEPVRVSIGSVQENTISYNRRFLMKDGSYKTNPGRANPNIVRPAGPIDPSLSIVYFESLDKRPLAILANFALHVAIVGGNQFSSDFPGVMSELIGKVKGEEVVTIFTNGASGNINHVNVSDIDQLAGFEESRRVGTILAGRVLAALPSLRSIEINSLAAKNQTVNLPIFRVTGQNDVNWARGVIANYGTNRSAFADVVSAWKILDLAKYQGGLAQRHQSTTTVPLTADGSALESEISVIALGDEIALVGFPGDAFTELGLGIKLNSPYPLTIVNEQSGNGTISYMPNKKAFFEGQYEVNSARYSPGGGELLVDAAIETLISIFYR